MNKSTIAATMRNIRDAVKKHSPEILMGIGIAGMITTTVMAVRATPKALILIEEKKNKLEVDELKPVETLKAAWACYIPAVVVGTASVSCLIGAGSVNMRRRAALATAYALSESALKEYQEKVVESIGEKKEQAVRDAVAKDKVEQNPVSNREVIILERGNTLCFDTISGRYFKSDIERIKKSINELNFRLRNEDYITLNDFYYEIGLNGTALGNDLGWNVNDGWIDVSFSSQLADDGTPCLVLGYKVAPRYDF